MRGQILVDFRPYLGREVQITPREGDFTSQPFDAAILCIFPSMVFSLLVPALVLVATFLPRPEGPSLARLSLIRSITLPTASSKAPVLTSALRISSLCSSSASTTCKPSGKISRTFLSTLGSRSVSMVSLILVAAAVFASSAASSFDLAQGLEGDQTNDELPPPLRPSLRDQQHQGISSPRSAAGQHSLPSLGRCRQLDLDPLDPSQTRTRLRRRLQTLR